MATQLRGRYQLVLAATAPDPRLTDYHQKHRLSSPVSVFTGDALGSYRLSGLPQTVVVNTQGVITRTWVGAYSGSVKREIETFLRVSLPGAGRF
jgi:hypothetical protein